MDSFYFLVPFERRGEDATALVAVDARFGDYMQTLAAPPEGLGLLRPLERRSLIERIVGHTHPLGGRQGRLTVRPEAYSIYPTLVWRPSLESLSPFAPFHMLTVGDRRIFVRLDGRVFTSLQTHIPGI